MSSSRGLRCRIRNVAYTANLLPSMVCTSGESCEALDQCAAADCSTGIGALFSQPNCCSSPACTAGECCEARDRCVAEECTTGFGALFSRPTCRSSPACASGDSCKALVQYAMHGRGLRHRNWSIVFMADLLLLHCVLLGTVLRGTPSLRDRGLRGRVQSTRFTADRLLSHRAHVGRVVRST